MNESKSTSSLLKVRDIFGERSSNDAIIVMCVLFMHHKNYLR